MPSITIYFRNGDFLSLGCTLEIGNIAYNAFVNNKDDEFVSLGVSDTMPRFAFRVADVIGTVVDPNDTTTYFLSSAGVRSAETSSKIPPRPQQEQPASEPAAIVPEAQQELRPQFRNANDIFAALLSHLVDNRMRVRSLLRVLGDAIDPVAFEAAFMEIAARDRDALTQEILLTEESFRQIYAEWLARQAPPPAQEEP